MINEVLTIEEIRERLNEGYYDCKVPFPDFKGRLKPDHIINEDWSIKKNREMVKEHNEKINNSYKEYNDESRRVSKLFKDDCIKAIKNGSIIKFDDNQAGIVFNKAYEHGHSGGHYEVIGYLVDEIEYLNKLFNI